MRNASGMDLDTATTILLGDTPALRGIILNKALEAVSGQPEAFLRLVGRATAYPSSFYEFLQEMQTDKTVLSNKMKAICEQILVNPESPEGLKNEIQSWLESYN